LVKEFDVQDFILIDWRDIMGVNVDELRDFNFTHIMTSAAVDKLFYLRVMQVAAHLKIPTLISRVSVQAVQKEYHVLQSHANEIDHVEIFCKAELQPESSDSKLENRNVAIVQTDSIGPATIQRMNTAIANEMKLLLLNHYGYLDKKTNRWIKKAFCDKWSSIFETFSKTGDRNLFSADMTYNSVIFQFEPLPHVVKPRLTITVNGMIGYSEKPDEFFSYVQGYFREAYEDHHYFLLDSESIAHLDLGEIRDEVQLKHNDGDENQTIARKRNLAKKKRSSIRRQKNKSLAGKKRKVDDSDDVDEDNNQDDVDEDNNQDDEIEIDNQDENLDDSNQD